MIAALPDSVPTPQQVDAAGCAALNCRASVPLRRVQHSDGRVRVLCPDHGADFLGLEVDQ